MNWAFVTSSGYHVLVLLRTATVIARCLPGDQRNSDKHLGLTACLGATRKQTTRIGLEIATIFPVQGCLSAMFCLSLQCGQG